MPATARFDNSRTDRAGCASFAFPPPDLPGGSSSTGNQRTTCYLHRPDAAVPANEVMGRETDAAHSLPEPA